MAESVPLLSVIVPIYNGERFLRKCLDSILAQSFEQMEIICVNDGSTDGSVEILTEYEKKDGRIRVLTKSNGGLVSARKAGVAVARGDYIGFVDADDWIEPEMYERLYGIAYQNNADLVTSGYVQEGNYISNSYDNVEAGVYSEEMISSLGENMIFNFQKRDKGIIASLCTKIFDASIMKRIITNIPDNMTMSEDKVTSLTALLHCRRAVVLHEAYYHYVMHEQSMTHSEDVQYLIHLNQVFQYLKSLYNHVNFTEKMQIQAELYVTQYMIKGINTWLGFKHRNLMWIDPYWMDCLQRGSKVAIYGAGALGMKYYQQIKASKKSFKFVGCVDFGYKKMSEYPFDVWPPEQLLNRVYDVLIITIKDPVAANKVKTQLISEGIKEESIRWFEQKEIFWKFAEADGLLE